MKCRSQPCRLGAGRVVIGLTRDKLLRNDGGVQDPQRVVAPVTETRKKGLHLCIIMVINPTKPLL
jgi:hypothetical protein